MVRGDGRTVGEWKGKFGTVEVPEVREPADANNERGNPEVLVNVYQSDGEREQYIFEFVRPHPNETFPIYSAGPFNASEGANLSKNKNKACFKAAEKLAEHTGIPVEPLVKPTDNMTSSWD